MGLRLSSAGAGPASPPFRSPCEPSGEPPTPAGLPSGLLRTPHICPLQHPGHMATHPGSGPRHPKVGGFGVEAGPRWGQTPGAAGALAGVRRRRPCSGDRRLLDSIPLRFSLPTWSSPPVSPCTRRLLLAGNCPRAAQAAATASCPLPQAGGLLREGLPAGRGAETVLDHLGVRKHTPRWPGLVARGLHVPQRLRREPRAQAMQRDGGRAPPRASECWDGPWASRGASRSEARGQQGPSAAAAQRWDPEARSPGLREAPVSRDCLLVQVAPPRLGVGGSGQPGPACLQARAPTRNLAPLGPVPCLPEA